MNCGLLGRKLSHSYSPQIHKELGDYTYSLYEKEPDEIEQFLKYGDFTAINVTIPYKKDVIPYCDALSPIAKRLGAVNTIVRQPDGSLIGHNTDYFGFYSMVQRSGLSVSGKKCLVLGSGGASNTVRAVLETLGADVITISRSGEQNYHNITNHSDAALIVNSTPVGMYPNNGSAPVSLDHFPDLEGVFDLIYNPARTQLLLQAEARGIKAENGLWMLVAQAKESAEWFTGKAVDDGMIAKIHSILAREMQNIILVGMPGSGKSTIGSLLAKKLNKTFVDADVAVEKLAGKSIPEIFRDQGEIGFRHLETTVLQDLGKHSGLVIATGGGCVTQPENYPLLHQNGTIIWLQREISQLPTNGRPLSSADTLAQMYRDRKPLYDAFADHIIDNNTVPETAVANILTLEGM